ncbi:hypothetical protein [Tropicimonas isoalkanivorans]|uniref:Uncharacterized protein n=1 Tax=Tropicimonas isoalkanivorans TaxID=441112 RepID=A0A1I1DC74_9RHOB|nr:hypothetical protein [Tropicimonas isoalkanivorans]SFB72521.1 hypothetical protein SAMN04488094_101135 [Tropicimonas isoalkanivorans]
MTRRVKVYASDISDLQDFLSESGTDMGPGAIVLPDLHGVATVVLAEEPVVEALRSRRTAQRRLTFLDIFTDPRDRLDLVNLGNRFHDGTSPIGLGVRTAV